MCEYAHDACIGNMKPWFKCAVLRYLIKCVNPIINSANDSVDVLFVLQRVANNFSQSGSVICKGKKLYFLAFKKNYTNFNCLLLSH